MKLPPSSVLGSIALTNLSLVSASAVLASSTDNIHVVASHAEEDTSTDFNSDIGILNLDNDHSPSYIPPTSLFRNLQSTCPETCSSDLCSCVAQYGYANPCSSQLHDVCTNVTSTLSDCVVPEYVYYYQNVYCPFASCRVSGGSYESCTCESYINFCNIYGIKQGYETDEKTAKYCGIAACCSKQSEDGGRRGCLEDPFVDLEGATASVNNTVSNSTTAATVDETTDTTVEETTTDATTAKEVSLEPIDLTGGGDTTDVQEGDNPEPPAGGAYGKKSAVSILVGVFAWFVMPM
ncbi:hypothetical protein ACHAWO_000699 [Cyclotella atomus]|uniref:Uncharacterized protein n=1 Tax=Cyclotella atomus TaxID=382360 RepID=A0ABD3QXN9_9STRA